GLGLRLLGGGVVLGGQRLAEGVDRVLAGQDRQVALLSGPPIGGVLMTRGGVFDADKLAHVPSSGVGDGWESLIPSRPAEPGSVIALRQRRARPSRRRSRRWSR